MKLFRRILFGGGCFLCGMFTLTLLIEEITVLPLERMLGKNFDEVIGEASELIECFPVLGQRETLVTHIRGSDLFLYENARVVQLWVAPSAWERWQKIRQPQFFSIKLSAVSLSPFWRELLQRFLSADESYLQWPYPLKNGWSIVLISSTSSTDHSLVPILALFTQSGGR